MVMTNEDIIKEFREAAVPTKQIAILADQNLCSKQEIADILIAGGCENVPKWYTKDKAPEKAPEKKEEKAVKQEKEKSDPIIFDERGNVIVPLEEWTNIVCMRLELEHILTKENAVDILIAVNAVKEIRRART